MLSTHEAAILERAMDYFALRDCGSQLNTATRIVNSYLLSVGLPEPTASSALARHLCAIFGYRILRDIYRLSAASRLRTAAVSIVERQKGLRTATSIG
jgi:phage gp36-like protein